MWDAANGKRVTNAKTNNYFPLGKHLVDLSLFLYLSLSFPEWFNSLSISAEKCSLPFIFISPLYVTGVVETCVSVIWSRAKMTEGNFALWVEPPLDFFHKFCFRVSEWQKNGGWRKIFCFWWTKKPIQWRSIGFDELLRRLSNDYCLMRLKRLRWKERC
jgi:hypothetical protein